MFWPKQIVCTKMRVFSPFLTQIVSGNFCKKSMLFDFSHFCMTTSKNTIFIGFFGLFHFFFFFFFFLFLFLQHKKDKNKECNFFSKTSFLTSPKFSKNTILAQCDTICVFKNAPKTLYNWGKNSKRKLGPVFNTRLGPVFNARNPKSWTSF